MKREGGFTLIEMMINVLILAILGSMLAIIFTKWFQVWRLDRARAQVQRDARQVLDVVTRNLRQGKATTVNLTRLNTSNPPYSKITFLDVDNDNWEFYQDGKKIYQVVNTSATLLSKEGRVLMFGYPDTTDNRLVSVAVTMENKTYGEHLKALSLSVEKVRVIN